MITSKVTDGREELYVYDNDHNLIETVIEGRTTHYKLKQDQPHLHRIEWIEKEDHKIHLHYDQHGNVTQEDHYDGDAEFVYSIYREYNERGQVISEKYPLDQTFTYTYDINGRPTHSSKTKERMEYDVKGRLVQHSDALHTTFYKYDAADNLVEKTDRFGTTHFTYKDKHLVKTVHGDHVTTSSYDVYGRETSRTDANGHTTHFQYNARSQPTHIDYPDGTSESYNYYPNGNLKSHTDPDGNTISYVYDSFSRVVKKAYDGIGEETFVYDTLHLLSHTDFEGYTTDYTYDDLGRKISEERCGRIIEYSYDSLSRVTSITRRCVTTSYVYDLLDRIIEESTPYSKIFYTYDEDGNKSSITTGDSTETFVYDPLKRLISQTDPLGNTTHIEYTDFQTITTDPKGTVTVDTYDIYQNLVSKEIPNVTAFRYTYDLEGNLIHQEEDVYKNGTYFKTLVTEYTYTPTNKLASITSAHETTHYTYTPSGKTKIKPDGTKIEYTYDFLGNCTQANSDTLVYNKLGHLIGGTGFTREVDPFGNTLKETLSNGLSIEKTYDDLDRPLTIKLPTGTASYTYDLHLKTISYKGYTHTYTYNLAGHLLTSGLTTYTRDAKGQITTLTAPHLSQECTYDSLGNLTFATPNSYTYDDLSQLTTEFDSHFDLPDVPETGNLSTHNGLKLLYDEHDRLIQAGNTHFTYDALGRRLSKDDELYLYDGLEEVGSSTYAKIGNILLDINGTLAVPLFNTTYTLRYLIDPVTHAIINSYEFDPFGNPLDISESLDNPYRYAFKHYDEETSLIYFGKRYYDPSTRRWITPDPLGPIDSVNLYAFVRNNPFRYIDYVGLFSLSVINTPNLDQQVSMELTRMKAPYTRSISFGELNRWDKKIIYIHGINSPIERTEYCIQKISDYAGGQKTTGIYNPTNGAYRDGFEYSERAKPVFLIRSQAEKELSYHLTSFHLTAPPSAKALLISYSGGATEARNGLYSSLPILRYRTLSVALAPSAIIPDDLCYLSWNYASKNDLVPKYALKMTPWLANQVTFLDPHPTASKWNDHDWDSKTYQIQLAEDVGIYMKRTY